MKINTVATNASAEFAPNRVIRGSVWKPLQIPDSAFERLGTATLRLCVYRVSDRVSWLALQSRGAAGQAAASTMLPSAQKRLYGSEGTVKFWELD